MTAASDAYRDQLYRALHRACELPGATVDATTSAHLRSAAESMAAVLAATHTAWIWHRDKRWNGWALYRNDVLLGYVERVRVPDGMNTVDFWHPCDGTGRPLTSTPFRAMEQAREAVHTATRTPAEAATHGIRFRGQASVSPA